MRYNFRVREDKETGEFIVDMKCLNCDYEEVIPMDIFSELFDPDFDENPAITCPHCNHDLFIPKDVYDQIKGNFVYKPDKNNIRRSIMAFYLIRASNRIS